MVEGMIEYAWESGHVPSKTGYSSKIYCSSMGVGTTPGSKPPVSSSSFFPCKNFLTNTLTTAEVTKRTIKMVDNEAAASPDVITELVWCIERGVLTRDTVISCYKGVMGIEVMEWNGLTTHYRCNCCAHMGCRWTLWWRRRRSRPRIHSPIGK